MKRLTLGIALISVIIFLGCTGSSDSINNTSDSLGGGSLTDLIEDEINDRYVSYINVVSTGYLGSKFVVDYASYAAGFDSAQYAQMHTVILKTVEFLENKEETPDLEIRSIRSTPVSKKSYITQMSFEEALKFKNLEYSFEDWLNLTEIKEF